ncbi:MAG: hypothetical protein IPK59_20465 [Rhodospirillaceae bacterium]|nr:hypothetical protein [Rhodospirillaceae bacterium]
MSRTSTVSRALALALSLGTLAIPAAPAAAGDGIRLLGSISNLKTDPDEATRTGGNAAPSGNELGQLTVQEQTARRSTTSQSSSNLLKKNSDTQNAIIQNIK